MALRGVMYHLKDMQTVKANGYEVDISGSIAVLWREDGCYIGTGSWNGQQLDVAGMSSVVLAALSTAVREAVPA